MMWQSLTKIQKGSTPNRCLFVKTIFPSLFSQNETTSNDMCNFKQDLKSAKEVVIMTGSGISIESGIPATRYGNCGWRDMPVTKLCNPETFTEDPSLVWEYHHFRRELILQAKPNATHIAIAEYEMRYSEYKNISVLTQNVDNLHLKAGTKNLTELHGNLLQTRCMKCGDIEENTKSPICEALKNFGSATAISKRTKIPLDDLPHCRKPGCNGLLRPHVIWYGEPCNMEVIQYLDPVVSRCDVVLVIGTSLTAYPAAAYPTMMASGGAIVAEFNIAQKPSSKYFDYYFQGPSSLTVPQALYE